MCVTRSFMMVGIEKKKTTQTRELYNKICDMYSGNKINTLCNLCSRSAGHPPGSTLGPVRIRELESSGEAGALIKALARGSHLPTLVTCLNI